MKNKKQIILIEYILASPDTFALVQSILKPSYFDVELRPAVNFIKEYFDRHNSIPCVDLIAAETEIQFKKREQLTLDEINYCSHEIEQFCKEQAMDQAIIQSAGLLAGKDYGKIEQLIRDAITIGIDNDIGLDYFEDPKLRLEHRLQKQEKLPTNWKLMDDALFGGPSRKELLLFSANSGGGKSIVMTNLALNYVESGLNVIYISLELSQDIVASRVDCMISELNPQDWEKNIDATTNKIKHFSSKNDGRLFIKYMNAGSNCNDFKAYLKEFQLKYGILPDVIIVDYLDIMGSNEQVSADNVSEKDKRSSEQLRNIGAEYNVLTISASQQNRGAVTATQLNHSHIAGGITKINTADNYISIIMNDTHKASGEIGFQFMKTRNSDGVGKTIFLKWDNSSLRIRNPDNTDPDFVLPTRSNKIFEYDYTDGQSEDLSDFFE